MKISAIQDVVGNRKSREMGQRILGLAILLHALGLLVLFFRMHHTNFGNYLFMVLEIDHAKAAAIEMLTVSGFVILCMVNLFYHRTVILLLIFAYVFLEAWAGFIQGGYPFSQWTFGAHALRFLTPVALMALVVHGNPNWNTNRTRVASWILRIGLATVFMTHGMECLQQNPRFIDLLIGSIHTLFGVYITEDMAIHIMRIIGWIDVVVALLVLIKPHKALLAWLCLWAVITAFSRMTSLGSGAYTEVLLRASHILAPVAIWVLTKPGRPVKPSGSLSFPNQSNTLN